MNYFLRLLLASILLTISNLYTANAQCNIAYANALITTANAPLHAATCNFTFSGAPYLVLSGSNCSYTYYKDQAATMPYSGNPVFNTTFAGTSVVIYVSVDDNNPSTPEPSPLPFTLNIVDITAPTIVCPANQNVTATGNNCTYSFATGLTPISINDNCTTNVSYSHILNGITNGTGINNPINKNFNIGNTVVTYTAKDISNNTATCSFTVSVTETVKPVIVCPQNVTTNAAANACSKQILSGLEAPVLTDNCTAMTQNANIQFTITAPTISAGGGNADFRTFNVGNHIVKYIATDNVGNTATCTFTVLVKDVTPPTLTCQSNRTINTINDTCFAFVTLQQTTPFAQDNCSVNSLTTTFTTTGATAQTSATAISNITNLPFLVGTSTVTYKVTDAFSNTATCSMNIQVIDNQIPKILCNNNNTSKTVDTLQCSSTLMLNKPSLKDNCTSNGNLVLGYTLVGATSQNGIGNIPVSQLFNTGFTTVTYKVSDAAMNTANCSFTVFMKENANTAPTLNCVNNITTNAEIGTCNKLIMSGLQPSLAQDNCPNNLVLSYSLSGAMTRNDTIVPIANGANGLRFGVGTTVVRYILKDAVGNADTCIFNVTVKDIEKPIINCITDVQTATLNGCNKRIPNLKPSASDNCGLLSSTFMLNGATTKPTNNPSIDSIYFNVGVTTVTWLFRDNSQNIDTCRFNVSVTENIAPTLICPSNLTIRTTDTACTAVKVALPIPSFSDNCTLSANISFQYNITGVSMLNGTNKITSLTLNKGVNIVTFQVSDFSQNTAVCSFQLTVADSTKPLITCAPSQTYFLGDTSCQMLINPSVPLFSDNCAATLAYNIMGATQKSGTGYVVSSLFQKGVSNITYTATDAAQNSGTCSFNVSVLDSIKPTILCPKNIAKNSISGTCSNTFDNLTPLLSDNCIINNLILTSSINNGSFTIGNANNIDFMTGNNVVRYIVTDASANSASCSFEVTVNDIELPIARCKDTLNINLDNSGNIKLQAATLNNGSNDNCTSALNLVFSASKIDFNCTNLGFNTVQLTVKDASGNSNNCLSTVKIMNTNTALNMQPNVVATPETYLNAGDGTLAVSVQGGLGVYSYLWSNNQTVANPKKLSVGTYQVVITDLTSGCAIATQGTVKAGQKVAFELSSVIGGQGNIVTIPVKVSRFKHIKHFTASFVLPDQLVAQLQTVSDFAQPDMTLNHFTVNKTTITLDYTSSLADGISMNDGTVLFNIKAKLVGGLGQTTILATAAAPMPILVEQFIPSGLYSAPFDLLFSAISIGNANGISRLSGVIKKEDGSLMKGVTVKLSGTASDTVKTIANGAFSFDVTLGYHQKIRPSLNLAPKNGVTSFDLSVIQRHILGIQPLANNYKRIAADVNNSGTISSSDLLEIRWLILGISNAFAKSPSWRFVPEDYVFPDPFTKVNLFKDSLTYSHLLEDKPNQNFIAIKMGDVNNSASAFGNISAQDRENQAIVMEKPFCKTSDSDYNLPFYANNIASSAAQFSLKYNAEDWTFVADKTDKNTFVQNENKGVLNVIWTNPVAQMSDKTKPLFNLHFSKNGANTTAIQTEINAQNDLSPQVFDENGQSFQLIFGKEMVKNNAISIFPNPAHETATLAYESESAETIDVNIYDIRGVLLSKSQQSIEVGQNNLRIQFDDKITDSYNIIEVISAQGVWKTKVFRY